jgi:3-oxoadipate enol-lactonase
MSGRLVKAGDLQLWVEQDGAGPPVLLIAGLGYASWCWLELRQALLPSNTVVAFDNRGAGRSDKPPGPYTIAGMADDAAALLDALGLARAHVVGHSMGGYIALTLALRRPGKVQSLVLVGTSPGGPDTEPVPQETLDNWQKASGLAPAEYARTTMPRTFAPGWTDAHPQAFERVLARRLEFPTPPQSWLAQYQACEAYVAEGVPVERIAQPALVIHGALDRVVPHANGQRLAERLPQADFVSLPQAGHLPFLEDPQGFAGLVRHALR